MATEEQPVVHLDELEDEEIQTIIMQGFAILAIRWESPLPDMLRDLLMEIEEEESTKPVDMDWHRRHGPDEVDPED